jgi:hypothetical protein
MKHTERKAQMPGKIKSVVVSLVLGALAFGGFSVALAASSAPGLDALKAPLAALSPASAADDVSWAMGQISAIGSDNFTVMAPLGGTHVVYVNDQTLYFNHAAQASPFAALQVGDRVLGASTSAGGTATARLVIDLGLKTIDKRGGIGAVTGVNSGQQSFTFKDRHGTLSEVFTDANTKITDRDGNAKTFAGIQTGMRLFVHLEQRADGQWWAIDIKLGQAAKPAASTSTNQS